MSETPYEHSPLAGWTAGHDGFDTFYTCASASIHVLPAIDVSDGPRATLVSQLGLPADRATTAIDGVMHGHRWTGIAADDTCVEAYILEDGARYYAAVGRAAFADREMLIAAVDAIAISIVPLPRRADAEVVVSADRFRRAIHAGVGR